MKTHLILLTFLFIKPIVLVSQDIYNDESLQNKSIKYFYNYLHNKYSVFEEIRTNEEGRLVIDTISVDKVVEFDSLQKIYNVEWRVKSKLIQKGSFNNLNQPVGLFSLYLPSVEAHCEYNMQGKKRGIAIFKESGYLKFETYKNGFKEGYEKLVKDNLPIFMNHYRKGEKDGTCVKYGEENGRIYILRKRVYVNGVLKDGIHEDYYSNGMVSLQYFYEDEKLVKLKVFDEDGKLNNIKLEKDLPIPR